MLKTEESLSKYTKMNEKLRKRDDFILLHQLTLIKYFLKTIKLNAEFTQLIREEIKDVFYYSQSHSENEIRTLAFECMGLLMIHNKLYFEDKL